MAKPRYVIAADSETGEVLTAKDFGGEGNEVAAIAVLPSTKAPKPRPQRQRQRWEGHFMADQDGFKHLAELWTNPTTRKEFGLTGRTRFVLDYLFSQLDFQNFIRVPQTRIAKDLGIGRAHVSREIAKLAKVGIIVRGPKVGNSWTYQLDPYFGWKGDHQTKQRKVAELDAKRRDRFRLDGTTTQPQTPDPEPQPEPEPAVAEDPAELKRRLTESDQRLAALERELAALRCAAAPPAEPGTVTTEAAVSDLSIEGQTSIYDQIESG